MASIISIPQPVASPPVPNSTAPGDNGVNAAVNPPASFAGMLAGMGQAATAAKARFNGQTLPAYDPNGAPPAPPAPAPDPNASPLHQMLSNLGQMVAYPGAALGMPMGREQLAPTDPLGRLATPSTPAAKLANFIGGNDATTAAQREHDTNAEFYSDPDVQKYLVAHPEFVNAAVSNPSSFAATLAPVVAMAKNAPQATFNGKVHSDPAGIAAKAAQAGVPPETAAAFHESHQYSEDEFVKALSGKVSYDQAAKLWQMQHYLSPQQQVSGDYLSLLHNKATQDEQAYQEALSGGKAQAVLTALDKKRQASQAETESALRAMSLGQNVYYNPGLQQ